MFYMPLGYRNQPATGGRGWEAAEGWKPRKKLFLLFLIPPMIIKDLRKVAEKFIFEKNFGCGMLV
jgi:hypothetical protein